MENILNVEKHHLNINDVNRILKKSLPENIVKPILQEFEEISQKSKNFVTSPDLVNIGFSTISELLKEYSSSNSEVNKDYQRCIDKTKLEKWTKKRKNEYLDSILGGVAHTPFNIVDYVSCKFYNPEHSDYFDNLINKGVTYGILDGGHRFNFLRGIFQVNDNLTKENVDIISNACVKHNLTRNELLDKIRNSIVYFQLGLKLTQKQIHILFKNLNSGVPTTKNDITNGIIGDLNTTFFHKFRETEKIQKILNYFNWKDDHKILYYTYYIESNKDLKKFSQQELNRFIETEKIDTSTRDKFVFIHNTISDMIDSYSSEYKEKISISKTIGLFQELSVIYDNGKSVKKDMYSLFVKIFSAVFDKNNVGKKGKDTIYRSTTSHFDEKWRFFRRLFNETSTHNFKTVSDAKMSIHDFLI